MASILVRQDDGAWFEPQKIGYALESELQEILANHPELIPGVSSEAKACREFQSEVGPADIVVVDAGGEVTLVECKLASNPQIRREIVGQMFDYASRLWKMDVDEFAQRWRDRSSTPLWDENTETATTLKESLALNLTQGNFRIVLAVDAINAQLRLMVEYLNMMAGPGTSIVAVEYARRRHGELELLLPHVFGEELANAKSTPENRQTTRWEASSIRSWLLESDRQSLEAFDELINSALKSELPFLGSRSKYPAGTIPIFDSMGTRLGTVSIFYFSVQGLSLEFNFKPLSQLPLEEAPESEAREFFLNELIGIPGLEEVGRSLRRSSFASRKPNVPLSQIPPDSVQRVVNALRIFTSFGSQQSY